ncbi:MAG: patatin-like phospholipase family protein [Alphaproteobacteria bacterium]
MSIILYVLLNIFICFNLVGTCHALEMKNSTKQTIKILSIDGGGIRGIIPALILANLESRLHNNKRIIDHFNIVSGTSTGGIIALLLATPDNQGKAKYNINEVLELYERLGNNVFNASILQKLTSGFGWLNSKYSAQNLEKLLDEYFGNAELKNSLTNIIIPAYEIEIDKTFFFKNTRAVKSEENNFKFKDIARATSAAPGYFKPAIINNSPCSETYVLIDGGISINNPSLAATVYGLDIYGKDNDYFVLSLGTGSNYGAKTKLISSSSIGNGGLLNWAKKIVPLLMHSSSAITDYELYHGLNVNYSSANYYRLQPILELGNITLDDARPETIKKLKEYANKFIIENDSKIQEIADFLNRH